MNTPRWSFIANTALVILGIVCDEFLDLCRKTEPSIFRKSHPDNYLTFKWAEYGLELETRAPVFLQLCKAIVEHGDHRNEQKKGGVHLPAICMAIAVLLKERNREMVGLQTCTSLLLYASHVQKQVRLHVRMCILSCALIIIM